MNMDTSQFIIPLASTMVALLFLIWITLLMHLLLQWKKRYRSNMTQRTSSSRNTGMVRGRQRSSLDISSKGGSGRSKDHITISPRKMYSVNTDADKNHEQVKGTQTSDRHHGLNHGSVRTGASTSRKSSENPYEFVTDVRDHTRNTVSPAGKRDFMPSDFVAKEDNQKSGRVKTKLFSKFSSFKRTISSMTRESSKEKSNSAITADIPSMKIIDETDVSADQLRINSPDMTEIERVQNRGSFTFLKYDPYRYADEVHPDVVRMKAEKHVDNQDDKRASGMSANEEPAEKADQRAPSTADPDANKYGKIRRNKDGKKMCSLVVQSEIKMRSDTGHDLKQCQRKLWLDNMRRKNAQSNYKVRFSRHAGDLHSMVESLNLDVISAEDKDDSHSGGDSPLRPDTRNFLESIRRDVEEIRKIKELAKDHKKSKHFLSPVPARTLRDAENSSCVSKKPNLTRNHTTKDTGGFKTVKSNEQLSKSKRDSVKSWNSELNRVTGGEGSTGKHKKLPPSEVGVSTSSTKVEYTTMSEIKFAQANKSKLDQNVSEPGKLQIDSDYVEMGPLT